MFSYTDILKKSYLITRNFPILWVFGFFVVGGFSLNFLHFADLPARQFSGPFSWGGAGLYFQAHPMALAALSFSVLVVSVGGLLLTNWCRIMLVLLTQGILEKSKPNLPVHLLA